MRFLGCVFAPGLLVLCTESLVEQGGRSFVPAVSVESLCVVGYRPVRRFVFDEIAVLQSRERGADRALIKTDLRLVLDRINTKSW